MSICTYGTTISIPSEIECKPFNPFTQYVVYVTGKIQKEIVEKCTINNIPIVKEEWLYECIKSKHIEPITNYIVSISDLDIDDIRKRSDYSQPNNDERKQRLLSLLKFH